MSLTRSERAQTSDELLANLSRSGKSIAQLAADLELTAQEIDDTLNIRASSRPEHVWLLRDHLQAAVIARRRTPVAYTVLTERMRGAASRWFPLRTPPSGRPTTRD